MPNPVFKHAADLGDNGNAGGNWTTGNYTCDAASNYLICTVAADSGDTVTSATFNGVSMTLITKVSSSRYHYTFELFNPSSGAHTFTVNQTGGGFLLVGAADYANVDTRGNQRTDHQASNTVITSSITTTKDNGLIVCTVMGFDGNAPTAGTGATRRAYDASHGTWGIFDGNANVSPAGATSIQTQYGSAVELGQIAFILYPAALVVGAASYYYNNR